MPGRMLHDPKARSAYVATKIVVFGVAALLTWPLAEAIGPQAWWGLAVFGVVLLALGAAVLGMPAARAGDAAGERDGAGDEPDPGPAELVALPIEDWIDLHSFPPRDIPRVVDDYLRAAHDRGYRELRLIHGRGIGVQRERVRSVLSTHPLVREYYDAPPERGGWGATIAVLKDSS
jgi:Smr domain